MIDPKSLINELKKININFYTGVPDSLMSEFSKSLHFDFNNEGHIISTNEGSALATGMGYHLATGETPLIYMQNSGLGNFINPYTSLMHQDVYDIPFLLLVGWRGEPGIKDEPQHVFQGKITKDLLNLLEIDTYKVGPKTQLSKIIEKIEKNLQNRRPIALLIQKNTFIKDSRSFEVNLELPKRKDALSSLVKMFDKNSLFISTTGKLSRELFELRVENQLPNDDFYTVGGMGHASAITFGLLQKIKKRKIICLDGDGSILMHTGNLSLIGNGEFENFVHIVFNNSSHESVGGQPNNFKNLDRKGLFGSLGYKNFFLINNIEELEKINLNNLTGPIYLEIKVQNSSDPDLMRPNKTPIENKLNFIERINNESDNS